MVALSKIAQLLQRSYKPMMAHLRLTGWRFIWD